MSHVLKNHSTCDWLHNKRQTFIVSIILWPKLLLFICYARTITEVLVNLILFITHKS